MLKSKNLNGHVVLSNKMLSFTFPLGIGYLAGYLIEKNEKVAIEFWPNIQDSYRLFAQKIISQKPLLIGFGGLYPDLYAVKKIIEALNECGRDFPVVIGGQMVSPTPEFALSITGADYGVIGEGEIIFYDLIKTLRSKGDVSQVKGIVFSEGKEIFNNGPGDFIENLKDLPKIPYNLFEGNNWLHMGRFYLNYSQPQWRFNDRIIPIHGARGCPFKCNFCYHHSQPRYRPMDLISNEIIELVNKYHPTILDISDDTVIYSSKRAEELVRTMRSLDFSVEYYLSCRFDTLSKIDDDLLKELKDTGCRVMGPGFESGSQKVLDTIGKGITVDQIQNGLRRLKDVGIMTTTGIQVGQYNESMEDAQKSMDLMVESMRYDKHIAYAFTITTPFPGSDLYNKALQEGILKSDEDFYKRFNPNNCMSTVVANMSSMTNNEILMMQKKMNEKYFEIKYSTMNWITFSFLKNRCRIKVLHDRISNKIPKYFKQFFVTKYVGKFYNNFINIIIGLLDFLWRKSWGAK